MAKNGETLADLITDWRESSRQGSRTYEQLAKNCGGSPSATRLQAMAKNGIQDFPSTKVIENLSAGLDVSPRRLVLACARSVGLSVGADSPSDLVLRGAGRLPAASKDLLVNMSRQLQEGAQLQPESQESKPGGES